jgi:hypothetical protein
MLRFVLRLAVFSLALKDAVAACLKWSACTRLPKCGMASTDVGWSALVLLLCCVLVLLDDRQEKVAAERVVA